MFKFCLIVLCAVWPALSGVMSDSLRNAVFLFEMHGEFQRARTQLERIARSPLASQEERGRAQFYLGKIAELADKSHEAVLHYRAVQPNTTSPAIAYWLADRESRLDSSPQPLLRTTQKLPFRPTRTIEGSQEGFLLENQAFWQVKQQQLLPSALQAPAHAQVLAIANHSLWYMDPAQPEILRQKQARGHLPGRSITLDGPVLAALPVDAFQTVALTARSLYWINGENIQWKISQRYAGCATLGIYAPTRHLALDCPDNALHFLAPEDGTEKMSLALVDNIQKAELLDNGVLLSSALATWFYQPHLRLDPVWRHSGGALDMHLQGDQIALLGANGTLSLLNRQNGQVLTQARSEGEHVFPVGVGLLGTVSSDGLLSVYDTLLSPLWQYHFASPLQTSPLITRDALFFPLRNGKVTVLAPYNYGKKASSVQKMETRALALADSGLWDRLPPLVDSLMKQEAGNPAAWYLQAQLQDRNQKGKESSLSWANAALYARNRPDLGNRILRSYARGLGAQYVQYLELSPRTLYPRLYGDGRTLYLLDAAARQLQAINPQQGQLKWTIPLGKLGQSPVVDLQGHDLVIASGFALEILDLSQKGRSRTIELPGKPYQIWQNAHTLYVTTWNGFLLKYQKPSWQLAWSRKYFSGPAMVGMSPDGICLLSQDGDLLRLADQSPEESSTDEIGMANPAFFKSEDGLLLFANQDDLVLVRSDNESLDILSRFHTGAQILSVETLRLDGEPHALFGLANQQLALYHLGSGKEVWRFQGQGSIFVQPRLHEGAAWIDQGKGILALDLRTGHTLRSFPIPEGGVQLHIMGNQLYGASHRRLLYSFGLTR